MSVIKSKIEHWPHCTLQDLTKMFDLTAQRVNQLERDGVITKAARGEYNILNTVLGYVHFLRDENKNRTKTASASALNEAKARLVDAQVEQKTGEIKAEIRAESVSAVERLIGELLADIHALPARVTRDMDMRKKIEAEIERIHAEAYKRAERQTLGLEDGDEGAETEG